MSSPSRLVIDPAMYTYENEDRKNGSLPPATRLLPSNSQSSGLSGLTPMISRTLSNDPAQHNMTPSSKMLPSMYSKPMGSANRADYDYPGLNLTPFFSHNLNLPGSAGSNLNFTPFYDKSMHLADFFMESPIRHAQKVETITPSKFPGSGQPLDATLNAALSLKRSITQIDTPARHPYKKYDAGNSDTDDSDDDPDYRDLSNELQLSKASTRSKGSKKSNGAKPGSKGSRESITNASGVSNGAKAKNQARYPDSFVTPSKKNVLKETLACALNKTPLHDKKNMYQTPKPNLVSSPSTVIMSSTSRTPDNVKQTPPSPTPVKEIEVAEPVMGIFSERKEPKPRRPKKQLAGMSKFQIVFTDVHTLMNNRKKKGSGNASSRDKKKTSRRDKQDDSGADTHGQTTTDQQGSSAYSNQTFSSESFNTGAYNTSTFNSETYRGNETQSRHKQGNDKHDRSGKSKATVSPGFPQLQVFSFHQTLSSLSASQDYNSTVNTLREFSVLGNSSTVNTTNSNLNVTDQSSFDLVQGGLMSTPNGKFLLDHLFDRASPQAVTQMTSSLNQVHVDSRGRESQPMPPPRSIMLQQAAQQALRHDTNPMVTMMSTPQRQTLSTYMGEFLPSSKDSLTYVFQQLHLLHHMNSPETQLFMQQGYAPGQRELEAHSKDFKDYQNDYQQEQYQQKGGLASAERKKRSNRKAKQGHS